MQMPTNSSSPNSPTPAGCSSSPDARMLPPRRDSTAGTWRTPHAGCATSSSRMWWTPDAPGALPWPTPPTTRQRRFWRTWPAAPDPPDLLDPLALGATTPAVENDANPSTALTKRLVRRILEELKGDRRQLTARHVEQVLHLAMTCSSGHRVHLPAGVVVERSFDRLVFSLGAGVAARMGPNETECARQPFQYLVEIGSQGSATISIPEIGRRFRLKVIDWPPAASDTRVEAEALDRDLLRSPLVLRNWRQGDSYRPRGRRRAHN